MGGDPGGGPAEAGRKRVGLHFPRRLPGDAAVRSDLADNQKKKINKEEEKKKGEKNCFIDKKLRGSIRETMLSPHLARGASNSSPPACVCAHDPC